MTKLGGSACEGEFNKFSIGYLQNNIFLLPLELWLLELLMFRSIQSSMVV